MGFLDRKKPAKVPLNTQVSEALDAFRARAKNEAARYRDATDSEYWVAIAFATRAEKDAFIAELGIGFPLIPGTRPDKYLNGKRVLERIRKLIGK